MKLCIPTMSEKDELTEEDINNIFGFTDEEINIIEQNHIKGI
ncbi:hypothetical protein [Clostridium novyi]|nr:hypothetical protein [Clostridium novyi]